MTDRRIWPASARVAHLGLRGQVADDLILTRGSWHRLCAPLTDLTREDGARERQLPLGTRFRALDRGGTRVFGQAAPDGYCGWLDSTTLGPDWLPTHWLAVPSSHLYSAADLKSPEIAALPMGARLAVTGWQGSFASTRQGFVPARHLRPLGAWLVDPVAVARGFLGTPYLWGGNSAAGIDCSGLVQLAWRACGVFLPADSDQQERAPGLRPATPAPGDLVFWHGHVALLTAPGRIIHANAHAMAVTEDPLDEVCARIADSGGGLITGWLRPLR